MIIRSVAATAAVVALNIVLASAALATTIVGTFTGLIAASRDDTNMFGAGTGSNTLLGHTVTGSFSYVFEDVPANVCGGGGYGCYYDFDGANWLQMSVTINGVTLSVSPGTSWQGVWNHDKSTMGGDYFDIKDLDSISTYNPATNDTFTRTNYLDVTFTDSVTEFIPGFGVPTSGVWNVANSSNIGANGRYFFQELLYDNDTGGVLYSIESSADWRLLDLSLAVVQVPEPGTLALFGAGLVGLGLLTRRRREYGA